MILKKATIIKLMNYNQLNFYHANPFYKQDFLPDRAWYNRQARAYPSEMPSGKDFLPSNSRKHYPNKFNHSQIEGENILKSPQRFPFQNRIAQNKTYMRSLNTIDIQGASSNTRVNQSIKNKYKARDQINRQHQSQQMKQKTQEQKRRDAAIDYYHTMRKSQLNNNVNNDSRVSQNVNYSNIANNSVNPEHKRSVSLKKDLSDQYKKYIMHNSSNKFHKDIPVLKDSPHIPKNHSTVQHYHTVQHPSSKESSNYSGKQKYQEYPYPPPAHMAASSRYQNQFNYSQQMSPQYKKIKQYEQQMNKYAKRPSDVRKKNPTNLSISFNVAGQSVVTN